MRSRSAYNTPEWRRIRSQILKRDKYRCRVLGCPERGAHRLSVHHILPRVEGGQDNPENLIALCFKHHDAVEGTGIRSIRLIENWAYDHEEPAFYRQPESPTVITFRTTDGEDQRDSQRWHAVHVCDSATIKALKTLKGQHRSWEVVALHLHYPAEFSTSLAAIVDDLDAVDLNGENELRKRLGLPPVGSGGTHKCRNCGFYHYPQAACIVEIRLKTPKPGKTPAKDAKASSKRQGWTGRARRVTAEDHQAAMQRLHQWFQMDIPRSLIASIAGVEVIDLIPLVMGHPISLSDDSAIRVLETVWKAPFLAALERKRTDASEREDTEPDGLFIW